MICKVCGSDKVDVVDDFTMFEYKGKTIKVDNCKLFHCNNCKNEINDEKDWKRIEKILEKFRNDVN